MEIVPHRTITRLSIADSLHSLLWHATPAECVRGYTIFPTGEITSDPHSWKSEDLICSR
jgi:hypothetical protein